MLGGGKCGDSDLFEARSAWQGLKPINFAGLIGPTKVVP